MSSLASPLRSDLSKKLLHERALWRCLRSAVTWKRHSAYAALVCSLAKSPTGLSAGQPAVRKPRRLDAFVCQHSGKSISEFPAEFPRFLSSIIAQANIMAATRQGDTNNEGTEAPFLS